MHAPPFTAQILYLGLRCQTLYVNRNGLRPAWGGFEVERLFHSQIEVSQLFGFGYGRASQSFESSGLTGSQKADFTNSPSETVNYSHRFCYCLNGGQLTHLLT